MKIFFDGGCRPNPGEMEVAAVARGRLFHRKIGYGSSHRAEWMALLFALEIARELGERELLLLGDSASVVRQASGLVRGKNVEARACLLRFQAEAAAFRQVRVRHIGRAQNLAGIALAQIREASRGPSALSRHMKRNKE